MDDGRKRRRRRKGVPKKEEKRATGNLGNLEWVVCLDFASFKKKRVLLAPTYD